MIKKKGLCYNCLSGRHLAKECTIRDGCNMMIVNMVCGMRRHPLLHWARVNGIMYHTSKIVKDH